MSLIETRNLVAWYLLLICILPVAALPPLPCEFYGDITINGTPAPPGTEVIALIAGLERGSIITSNSGVYGGIDIFDERLIVVGVEGEDSSQIQFNVNGIVAPLTAMYTPGELKRIDLVIGDSLPETSTPTATVTATPTQTAAQSTSSDADSSSNLTTVTPQTTSLQNSTLATETQQPETVEQETCEEGCMPEEINGLGAHPDTSENSSGQAIANGGEQATVPGSVTPTPRQAHIGYALPVAALLLFVALKKYQ